jgi:hypothetical protein
MRRSSVATDPETLRQLLAAAGELRLVVVGGSMAPTIRSGDSVVIRPLDGAPRFGDVVVYARAGQLWCHRVLVPGRRMITKGDGRGRPDAPVPAGAIIGRAIALQRGLRIIKLHGLAARLTGLAFNLAAPAAALGRRLARGVGMRPAGAARRMAIAGFEVELAGPRSLLDLVETRRGRAGAPADFRLAVGARPAATTGGRYGLAAGGRRGHFTLTAPAVVARFDLEARSGRAEIVAGAELLGMAGLLRVAAILLATGCDRGIALHASAARHGARAWLFSGPGGAGKSTALGCAREAGAKPVADDVVLLRREAPGGRWLAWGPPLEAALGGAPRPDRRGVPVGALLVPAPGKALELEPLSPAEWVALAGNFPPAPGLLPPEEMLARLAELAESAPRYRLRFPDRPGALDDLARRLEAGA